MLALCALLVAFWEVMSNRSSRPFEAFGMTAADFADFQPGSDDWVATARPVSSSPIEPNILSYEVRRHPSTRVPRRMPVLIRLVHGYNMPDCMRIKGFSVELIGDTRRKDQNTDVSRQSEAKTERPTPNHEPRQYQVWRLTSEIGDVSIWVTGMLRAGDFAETDVDVRSMAFPKIGTPDDPSWLPRGMTPGSLRRPVQSFRTMLRAKWNNARCDLATFLRLRQPAWASEDMLTLVGASGRSSRYSGNEEQTAREVLAAHAFLLSEMQKWRAGKLQ